MKVDDIKFRQHKPAPDAHPIIGFIWDQINYQRVSQEYVAERAGVGSSTIRKWKRRDRSPSLLQIECVLNTLGFDLSITPSMDGGARSGRFVRGPKNDV